MSSSLVMRRSMFCLALRMVSRDSEGVRDIRVFPDPCPQGGEFRPDRLMLPAEVSLQVVDHEAVRGPLSNTRS